MVNLSSKNEVAAQNPIETAKQLFKIARPVHWIKNLSLFAALIFSGGLFLPQMYLRVILAFLSFSFATSATYIFNDIFDAKLDRLHPIKKDRPIAANKLTTSAATIFILALLIASFFIAFRLNTLFLMTLTAYLCIQAIYSLGLKNIPIIDILIIASGFILRVYAGAFVIDSHLSVWFLLCVISVALFLASGKRRAEQGALPEGTTRRSLTKYQRELLNSYVTMFGNATWMSWALFTFFESPTPTLPVWLFLAELSRTTTISKLLMITIPVVIFGIMRYEALIFGDRTEAPEKLLLKDKGLVLSVFLWVILVVSILYGGAAT
ncbi:UbiA prenyltransferase family protein [Patescibacteria group bacterium]|nr:UbiA prenyltransferase family protein [Patescibacteria group bacterium]